MAIRQKCQLDKLRVYVSLKDIQFKPEINVPFHEYFLAFYNPSRLLILFGSESIFDDFNNIPALLWNMLGKREGEEERLGFPYNQAKKTISIVWIIPDFRFPDMEKQ